MSRFNEHKKVLFGLLKSYCPSVSFQQAPSDAGFPRTVYELKQLSVEDYLHEKYLLTLNCYDKGQQESIDEYIDTLIAGIDKSVHYTDAVYYQFYYNQDRQPIAEQDKSLRRVMLTFEVRIYVRSD